MILNTSLSTILELLSLKIIEDVGKPKYPVSSTILSPNYLQNILGIPSSNTLFKCKIYDIYSCKRENNYIPQSLKFTKSFFDKSIYNLN